MNSGVITSSGPLEIEEPVEELGEAGVCGSLEWFDRLSEETGLGGESNERR